MPKIKEVYEYNNGSWANGTPIGADASNVDVALSDSTSTKDLQSVLGNVSVSDPSMKTQLTGKVNASGGDIKDTVVSVLDPASETDTSEDIDGTDVVVAAGESQTTMWSKFNMFRKRVSNKFSNFLISSVEDVLEPSDTKTYSQAALNSYFADVIGYKTDADVATVGSVADQLSTLNNKILKYKHTSSTSSAVDIASTHILHSNHDAESYLCFYYSNITGTLITNLGYCTTIGNFNYPAYVLNVNELQEYNVIGHVDVKWGTGYSYGSFRGAHSSTDINSGYQIMLASNAQSGSARIWIHLYFRDCSECINTEFWN